MNPKFATSMVQQHAKAFDKPCLGSTKISRMPSTVGHLPTHFRYQLLGDPSLIKPQ